MGITVEIMAKETTHILIPAQDIHHDMLSCSASPTSPAVATWEGAGSVPASPAASPAVSPVVTSWGEPAQQQESMSSFELPDAAVVDVNELQEEYDEYKEQQEEQ